MQVLAFSLLVMLMTAPISAQTPAKESAGRPSTALYGHAITTIPRMSLPAAPEPSAAVASRKKSSEGFHWGPAFLETLEFTTMQHAGNVAMDYWMRYYLIHGPFGSNYIKSVEAFRWSVWNDNDPFLDDYIAHPMQGAIYGYIEIENDPGGRYLSLEKSRPYIMSRLRAFAWSAAWSAQWKIGPLSEASIGNTGIAPYYSRESHGMTNGTGMVDFVVTPVGGMVWLVGEDAMDKYVVQRIEANHRKVALLFALSVLTPCRSAANILRFRSPWYRDRSALPR